MPARPVAGWDVKQDLVGLVFHQDAGHRPAQRARALAEPEPLQGPDGFSVEVDGTRRRQLCQVALDADGADSRVP